MKNVNITRKEENNKQKVIIVFHGDKIDFQPYLKWVETDIIELHLPYSPNNTIIKFNFNGGKN